MCRAVYPIQEGSEQPKESTDETQCNRSSSLLRDDKSQNLTEEAE